MYLAGKFRNTWFLQYSKDTSKTRIKITGDQFIDAEGTPSTGNLIFNVDMFVE